MIKKKTTKKRAGTKKKSSKKRPIDKAEHEEGRRNALRYLIQTSVERGLTRMISSLRKAAEKAKTK